MVGSNERSAVTEGEDVIHEENTAAASGRSIGGLSVYLKDIGEATFGNGDTGRPVVQRDDAFRRGPNVTKVA